MIDKENLKPTFKNADKLFFDNLEEIFDFMGDQRTTEREVLKGGRHFLGDFLKGVYAMGKQPPPDGTHHCVIVNTARTPEESMVSGHWIALLRHDETEIIYDSYGRDPSEFAPELDHLETTHRDNEQPKNPDIQWCGQACIAAAKVCKEYGLSMAKLI